MALRAYKAQINDGEWHVITCERTDTGIALTFDGTRYVKKGLNGTISNTRDAVLGGKAYCGTSWSDCDYFSGGNMDYVRVSAG